MSEREFFEPAAREAVRGAVRDVEARTSAELVVAVRRSSGSYRDVDWIVGSVTALALLLLMLFHPSPVAVAWMPFELLLAFGIGAFLSSTAWTLKRLLLSNKRLRESTWRAACTLFHEKGISGTTGRNGVLVFVSMLERRVEVVTDIGINPASLGNEWERALHDVRATVGVRPSFGSFLEKVRALGPILGAAMPRAVDDINELPDEPDVS